MANRHDPSAMLEAARRAVLDASRVCRRVQHRLADLRSVFKDDRSPVTVADFASQAVVALALRDELGPGVRLVGEEDADELRRQLAEGDEVVAAAVLEAVRHIWPNVSIDDVLDAIDAGNDDASGAAFWTLDPIDGTKGFLRGQQYAISLAYIERDVPTIAALGCPNLSLDQGADVDERDPRGSLYLTIRGDGLWECHCDHQADSWYRDGHMVTRPMLESSADIVLCTSVEAAHSNVGRTDRLLAHLAEVHGVRAAEPVRMDSQAKYAVVARGQADVYLRMPAKAGYQEKIWDHAAGALVAGEAGVFVTDVTGAPLDFSKGTTLSANLGVVAAPTAVHGLIIESIRELGYDKPLPVPGA